MPDSITAPAIGIASLAIRNFRGIEALDLNFRGLDGRPNRLVVLAGPNGCGKTAVLEAALLAAGGSKLVVGPQGRDAIRRGSGDYLLEAEFLVRDESKTVQRTAAEPDEPVSDSIPHWYFSSWRAPQLPGALDVTAGRRGRRPAKRDANRLKNVKQHLINAAAAERFSRQPRQMWTPYSEWIQKINHAWRDFCPDSGQGFEVGLTEASDKDAPAFDLFLVKDSGDRLEVDFLSSGQLEIFLLISALVLNDDREGIILIDEPELHLDPQWHRPIMRCLLRLQAKAQFVVATHSPQIYDAAQYFERHFLVPEDDPRVRSWVAPEGAEV